MTIPAFWFWALVVALTCVSFWAFWLWASIHFWIDYSMRLRKIIEPVPLVARLMYMAGARPRESLLTVFELAELEAAWPGHAYLERLPDGVDFWSEYPIVGGEK